MSDDTRLARIETKLDQMGEAIVALARMEETPDEAEVVN